MRQNSEKDQPPDESWLPPDPSADDIPPIDFRVDPELLEELKLPEELLPRAPLDPAQPGINPAGGPEPPGSRAAPAKPPATGSDAIPSPPRPAAPPHMAKAVHSISAPAARTGSPKEPAPTRPLTPSPGSPRTEWLEAPPPPFPVIDDDEAVMVHIARFTGPAVGQAAARDRALARSLFYRRTMIPILLTLGLMLPTLAILWFQSDPESLIRRPGQWLPVTFIVLGAIMLLLGVISMAQVKHLLAEARRERVR